MEFTGGQGILWVRLTVGKNFTSSNEGVWVCDAKLTIITPIAHLRSAGKQVELLAPVKLKANGKTTLEVELQW
jgi:hypothetical protein